MKYETYKQLNYDQKEEWTFKYSKINFPQASLVYLIILQCSLVAFSSIILISLKEYVVVHRPLSELFALCFNISAVMLIVWIIDYVGQLANYIYIKIKEKSFLRKCLKENKEVIQ